MLYVLAILKFLAGCCLAIAGGNALENSSERKDKLHWNGMGWGLLGAGLLIAVAYLFEMLSWI
jgi:hypothetical protein